LAFFYVKDNDGVDTGTADGTDAGRATTARTGTFAAMGVANYYSSIDAALSSTIPTNAVDGDFIIVSSSHDHPYGATATLDYAGVGTVFIICVDDSNADTQSRGAIEVGASNINFTEGYEVYGVNLSFLGTLNFTARTFRLFDSDLLMGATSNKSLVLSAVDFLELNAVRIDATANLANPAIICSSNKGYLRMNNGSFNGTSDFILVSSSQVCQVEIVGVDLSTVAGNLISIADAAITNEQYRTFYFKNCKLSASLTNFIDADFLCPHSRILVVNSSDVSADTEWQYFLKMTAGTAETVSAIHRDQSTPYEDSGQRASLEVITEALCSKDAPFEIDFEMRWSPLSDASGDTIRIYFTSDNTALTDDDVWVQVTYQDGTNSFFYNTLSSSVPLSGTWVNQPNRTTGSAIATDATSTWTGAKAKLYQLDIDTSSDPGRSSIAFVRIYVGVASETIYFDTEFETL